MKKKTKLIIVAVVVVIAVIAGSFGVYLGYFKPHKEAVDAYNVVVGDIPVGWRNKKTSIISR